MKTSKLILMSVLILCIFNISEARNIMNLKSYSGLIEYTTYTSSNTSFLLNTNNPILTIDSELSCVGSLALRITNQPFNVLNSKLDEVSIISNLSNNTIEINGQLNYDTKAELHDTKGRLILESALNINSTTQILDVTYLMPGVYTITLNINNSNEKRIEKLKIK